LTISTLKKKHAVVASALAAVALVGFASLANAQTEPAQTDWRHLQDMTPSTMTTAEAEAWASNGGWQPPIGMVDPAQLDASARNYVAAMQNICVQQIGTIPPGASVNEKIMQVPYGMRQQLRVWCLPSTIAQMQWAAPA
jgi:hypothetical protein